MPPHPRASRRPTLKRATAHLVNQVIQGPRQIVHLQPTGLADEAYCPTKGALMAKLAQLAYLDPEDYVDEVPAQLIRQLQLKAANDQVVPVTTTAPESFTSDRSRALWTLVKDLKCYVLIRDDMVVVVFCGTEPLDIRDWMVDFDFVPESHPLPALGGSFFVHEGFYAGTMALWSPIQEALEGAFAQAERPLYFVGHSLGGAMAAMAPAFLPPELAERVTGVYTYGQPRIGLGDWALAYQERFGGRTFRHVNNQDIVPRVPPGLDLQPDQPAAAHALYLHAGRRIGLLFTSPDQDQLRWNDVAYGWICKVTRRVLPEAIDDHFPEAYFQGALLETGTQAHPRSLFRDVLGPRLNRLRGR